MPKGRKPVCMPKEISAEVVAVNEAIVRELHLKKISEWRSKPLVRPDDYLATMLSAIRRVTVPLPESDTPTIKQALSILQMPDNTRVWVVRQINEVLLYLGKPTIVNPLPGHSEDVTYISLEKFQLRLPLLSPDYASYLGALYATGCRFAELPTGTIKGDGWYHVPAQIRGDGVRGYTKGGKKRDTAILEPMKSSITAYKALPEKRQVDLRVNHYYRLYGVCTRVYGVSIHTLRHSYAIECIKRGRSVAEVAKWIGDQVHVAEKHYIGYVPPMKSPWA